MQELLVHFTMRLEQRRVDLVVLSLRRVARLQQVAREVLLVLLIEDGLRLSLWAWRVLRHWIRHIVRWLWERSLALSDHHLQLHLRSCSRQQLLLELLLVVLDLQEVVQLLPWVLHLGRHRLLCSLVIRALVLDLAPLPHPSWKRIIPKQPGRVLADCLGFAAAAQCRVQDR